MKSLFFTAIASFLLSGISLHATAQKKKNAAKQHSGNAKKSTKFIEGIEIKAHNVSYVQTVSVDEKVADVETGQINEGSGGIEKMSSLQFKYAQLLDCNVEDIKNTTLYDFVDEWWETRYKYGGNTKNGVDCSAFTGLLMGSVYAIKLPRTARDQFNLCEKINKQEMLEGDLVFFNTRGGVSHVGIYLGEGNFVHASTNNGVTISKLSDPYYESRFIGAGRAVVQNNMAAQ